MALKCQLTCADDSTLGAEARQRCYERCSAPVEQLQATIDNEFNRVQVRPMQGPG